MKAISVAGVISALLIVSCSDSGVKITGSNSVDSQAPAQPSVTTESPTTEPPVVTEGPITEPPVVTEGPTTEPPAVTEGPSTEPPVVTEGPSTEPPVVTEGPTTEPPVVTEGPTTEPPVVTEGPTTEPPVVTEGPNTEPPVSSPTPTSLVGQVTAGYAQCDIDAADLSGASLGERTRSDSAGQFTIELGEYRGDLVITASSCEYTDEWSSDTVRNATFRSFVLSDDFESSASSGILAIQVTPFTEIAFTYATASAGNLSPSAIQLKNVDAEFEAVFETYGVLLSFYTTRGCY